MPQDNTKKVRWSRTAFGIDTADDGSLVIVRAERLGPTMRFQSVTPDAARAECTRLGTRVAAAIPLRDSVLRRIATPLGSRSKALRVLPSVLDMQVPFPIEECEYRFHDLRLTGEGSYDALAVAARHTDIGRRITDLGAAGFDPVTLDSEALALWTRSLKELPPASARETRILVSLHTPHAVVIIGIGRRILGAHHVRGNEPQAILRVLASYRRLDLQPTVRWCWTGPASAPTTVDLLHKAMQTVWPGTSTIHEAPDTFLARAVAARELSADDLPCNLRDGKLIHPARQARQLRRSTVAAGVTLACGVLMIASSLAAGWFGAEREADLTKLVSQTTDRLAGYHVAAKGEHALKIVRSAVESRIETLQPFRRQLIDSPAGVLPEILDSAKKNGLQIETLTLSPQKVTIAGTARAWQSCDDMVMRLERRGMKTRLDRRDARDDMRVPFILTAEAQDG